jgi:hypothetical protein
MLRNSRLRKIETGNNVTATTRAGPCQMFHDPQPRRMGKRRQLSGELVAFRFAKTRPDVFHRSSAINDQIMKSNPEQGISRKIRV